MLYWFFISQKVNCWSNKDEVHDLSINNYKLAQSVYSLTTSQEAWVLFPLELILFFTGIFFLKVDKTVNFVKLRKTSVKKRF